MQAIDDENMAVEEDSHTDIAESAFKNVDGTVVVKFSPKESDGEEDEGGGSTEGGTKFESEREFKKLKCPSRKFVDFSHAHKDEASLKAAKKTRKRAQVSRNACSAHTGWRWSAPTTTQPF